MQNSNYPDGMTRADLQHVGESASSDCAYCGTSLPSLNCGSECSISSDGDDYRCKAHILAPYCSYRCDVLASVSSGVSKVMNSLDSLPIHTTLILARALQAHRMAAEEHDDQDWERL